MRRRRLVAVAVCFGALVPIAASADAAGLSVAPANFDPANPATRSYFIETIAPGGTFTDQVRVANASKTALHLYVYPVDGFTGVTSGAVYANRQDPVRKWGAWVTPAVSTMLVPARTTTLVSFTVRVPTGASAGDHLAGIAFEDTQPATTSGSVQVTTIYRAVVGVLTKVPGAASFHVRVYGATIQPLSNQSHLAAIVIRLGDDGLLLGKPKVTVTVSGPSGYHDTVSRQLDTILPGDVISFPFPWPDSLAAGSYTVSVAATGPGMSHPSTLTRTQALGTPLQGVLPNGKTAPPANSDSGSAGPLVSLLLSVLLAINVGAGVWLLAVRWRRRGRAGAEAVSLRQRRTS